MAVDIPAIREIAERVCTSPDVLDACKRGDLGTVITVLCAHGITQGPDRCPHGHTARTPERIQDGHADPDRDLDV